MRFYHPEPLIARPNIYPVFIPFSGCAKRCVFCAQTIQSGQPETAIEKQLQEIRTVFKHKKTTSSMELAFYGGTFTALPSKTQKDCLYLAQELKAEGKITAVRCSTRPDAVTARSLEQLKKLGLDILELGIQSFSKEPLITSKRIYTPDKALAACGLVKDSGLRLGIQLMPGMPGMQSSHFETDIEFCVQLQPEILRLYPCLVIMETELAEIWRQGRFTPWSLEQVFRLLPPALLKLWSAGIKVNRIGLAPQDGLANSILDGPHHPALGQIVRSQALLLLIKGIKAQYKTQAIAPSLYVPQRFQGELFGHKGELKAEYSNLGLFPGKIIFHQHNFFDLC